MMRFPEQMVVAPLTQKLYQKADKTRIPLNGTFELSPMCNFNCQMCYIHKSKEEVEVHSRPMVTLEQWLQWGRQARDAGMLYLLLTGGEPLLWPNFWKLYEGLYQMGLLLAVNTNGSLIDEKVIRNWQKMPPYRVNITLYGATDATYEKLCEVKHVCRKVKQAIHSMKKAGLIVKLNCSLTPCNADDLKEMVQFAKDEGVPLTVSTYMYPPVRRDADMIGRNHRFLPEDAAWYHMQRYRYQEGEAAYRQFLKSIMNGMTEPIGLDASCEDSAEGRIRCRAGKATFWITWDGYMTPCGMMPEPKIDMAEDSFDGAWRRLVEISEVIHTSGVCEQCVNQRMCHSCAAMAYAETGTTEDVPLYLCETMQAMRRIAEKELAGMEC